MKLDQRLTRLGYIPILLFIAILLGSVLRFAQIGEIPPGFNQDEAVNGYDAYSLALTGRDHHGHPFPFAGLESFGDWASPLLTFVTAPAVGIFGLRVEVVRGVTAALGVLAILVIYLLGYELSKRPAVGVAAAFALALSPWAVARSRFAIPPAVVPLMVALTMLALVWTMQHQSDRGFVALAIIAALTMAAYPTMKLYVPLLVFAGLLIYGRTVLHLRREAVSYGAILFLSIAGPLMYLSMVDPGGKARLDQVSIFNSGRASILFIAQQYRSYFSPWVFFLAGNGHPGQSATPPGWGVEPLSALPFLIAGTIGFGRSIVRPSRPYERQGALFLLAALLLYPIPGSLTVPTPPLVSPHLSRGIHLIPFLALVEGMGAIVLVDLLKRGWRVDSPRIAKVFSVVLAIILCSAVILELGFRYQNYFTAYALRTDVKSYFQYGVQDALAFVQAHQADYDEVWMTDIDQPYIYLLFYAKWPPSDVHQNLQVLRAPPAFNEINSFGKYHFGDLPAVNPSDLVVLYRSQDSQGTTIYQVQGGMIPGRGRVLLLSKP